MPKTEDMVASLSSALETRQPSRDAEGVWWFGLDAGMRLGVRELPGGRECLVWAVAVPPPPGASPSAREAAAAFLLRLRLARLRRNPDMTLAMEDDGSCILYRKLSPESECEWRDAVSALLNEAEAMRKLAGSERSGGQPPPSLFSGMGAWMARP